jgi:hypothetical protein
MTLLPHLRKYTNKYSFIVKTEFKNAIYTIYYEHNGKIKKKRLPYRATGNQLVECVENIKKEIGYKEIKKERDKKVLEDSKKESCVIFSN